MTKIVLSRSWWLRIADHRACVGQSAAAALLVPAFALAPPSEGTMRLGPLLPDRSPAAFAVRHGALILARGPMWNSLIVHGRLGALAWPAMTDGVLALSAPAGVCGAAVSA